MMSPKAIVPKYTFLFVVTIVSLSVILAIEFFSGFLPSSADAKHCLAYSQLELIRKMIVNTWCVNGCILPRNWKDVQIANDSFDEYDLKDPFSINGSFLLDSFSENRIEIWTVGSNGNNDLTTEYSVLHGRDELILIITQSGDHVETQIVDLSEQREPTSNEDYSVVTFGTEFCK